MGWMYCGEDDGGRPIGYGVEATCDFPDCVEVIDRGLGYLCGEMHNPTEWGCGKYFCEKHRDTNAHQCEYPPEDDEPTDEIDDAPESLEGWKCSAGFAPRSE